jgi:hypothetical protein
LLGSPELIEGLLEFSLQLIAEQALRIFVNLMVELCVETVPIDVNDLVVVPIALDYRYISWEIER